MFHNVFTKTMENTTENKWVDSKFSRTLSFLEFSFASRASADICGTKKQETVRRNLQLNLFRQEHSICLLFPRRFWELNYRLRRVRFLSVLIKFQQRYASLIRRSRLKIPRVFIDGRWRNRVKFDFCRNVGEYVKANIWRMSAGCNFICHIQFLRYFETIRTVNLQII